MRRATPKVGEPPCVVAEEVVERRLRRVFIRPRQEAARDPSRREAIAEELADVLAHVMNFSLATGIDLSDALRAKMVKNALKYPAEKYRGRFSV